MNVRDRDEFEEDDYSEYADQFSDDRFEKIGHKNNFSESEGKGKKKIKPRQEFEEVGD